jgi:hypothetical protein
MLRESNLEILGIPSLCQIGGDGMCHAEDDKVIGYCHVAGMLPEMRRQLRV